MVSISAETNERDPNSESGYSVAQAGSTTSGLADIVMMDAALLESTIRSRRVSCVEVMTAYLDHIENLNPKVNAIVALQDRAGLLAQARERDAQLARAVEVREAYSA
jgi:amidase